MQGCKEFTDADYFVESVNSMDIPCNNLQGNLYIKMKQFFNIRQKDNLFDSLS